MLLKRFISCFIFVALLQYGCEKVEDYPTVPVINYTSHTAKIGLDQLGNRVKFVELVFTLKDGEGDIGLTHEEQSDTMLGIYRSNFFSVLYVKKDGEFVKAENIKYQNYAIPYIEPRGQSPALKADVKVRFWYTLYPPPTPPDLPYDTIRYEFYILDRAIHKSNTVVTPDIIFPPSL